LEQLLVLRTIFLDKNGQNFCDDGPKKEKKYLACIKRNQDTNETQKLGHKINKDYIKSQNLVRGHVTTTKKEHFRIFRTNHGYGGNKNLGHEKN
jgi:hypothetical protein